MDRKKKQQKLAVAVTLACLGVPSWAGAYNLDYVYHDGKKFAELIILNKGETFIKVDDGSVAGPAKFTLNPLLKEATISGVAYWADILGRFAKTNQPYQIVIATEAEQNASAATASIPHKKGKEPDLAAENYVAKGLQGKAIWADAKVFDQKLYNADDGMYAFSRVTIGQYVGTNRQGASDGWWLDTDTVLPANEQAADLVGAVRHELGHALGLMGRFQTFDTTTKKWTTGAVKEPLRVGKREVITRFDDSVKDRNEWNMHLIDQNGKAAKPGMVISTTANIKETLKAVPGLTEEDLFIVDNGADNPNLSGSKGFAYFVGDHVTEVLDGAVFNGMSGLPVNAWENYIFDSIFDGSHMYTTGMMSHRNYRNYTAFMEAELAVMQDLGYDLDRKAYFGYSVYGNGGVINNTHGYSARNAAGTAYTGGYSNVPLGIGLHIYGSKNTVTQSANILTHGNGAAGIRVDGIENTLIIPESTEVHADGLRGNGVLIAYGRGQKVKQSGMVTANGQGGTGIRFDFGSSGGGAGNEYRGSYIRYKREVDDSTGKISGAENLPLMAMNKFQYNSTADEMQGAMVDSYDLSGTLQGGENAIYISKNALVKNINVQDGAKMKGNITSDWKHFDTDGSYDAVGVKDEETGKDGEPLKLQYKGKKYDYNKYIPDLVTNLNFNLQDRAMLYQGNISGADNMKLNVNSGNLIYKGTADVVNVQVSKETGLYGGTYTVNDMTARMAEGFTDDTTGKFINHGTIGAASPESMMTINGNLESDGVLQAYGGGSKGNISVSGTANVEGSIVTAQNALPNETLTVLNAGAINGNVANPDGKPHAITGLLSTTGTNDGKTLKVTTQTANNLGELTAEQAEAYDAMEGMQKNLVGDTRREELRPLYNLNSFGAKNALTEIGASSGPQAVALTQQSTLASRVISDRLSTAFSLQPVNVNVPASHLADGEKEDGLKLSTKLPVAQDNNAWVKFTKNWGDLKGGANYHGSAVSGGYDRKLSDNWRGGVFLSYQTAGFGAQSSNGNIYDTRFGVYAGYHKNATDAYLYADYGWIKNKLRRSIGTLGLGAEAKYNSHLMEIGGEYKYDLHAADGKTWHVSPYAGFQLSWLNQDGYKESGAGIFNQQVDGKHNTYFAGQIGMEFKRYLGQGSYGMRLGVKHAFAGADPELSFRYEGYGGKAYTLRNNQDKTHFIFSLSGETEFAKGWFLSGETLLQKGAHDKDISASVQFKRVW